MSSGTARLRRPLPVAALLVTIAACNPAPPPAAEKAPELATVEVTAAPDAAYSMADDRVERRADPNALAGALPDGFPADIPVYRPSSLVDFTPRPDGGATVVFATPAEVATVSSAMRQRLLASGWQAGTSGNWTKAGRKLRLTVESTAAGARFRVEF
ncbi:MAG: hypothetical protein ABI689_17065 [Thermoanaerobaculia bacterium]